MKKLIVGIFGYGKVGQAVATRLKELGYEVAPFVVTSKQKEKDNTFTMVTGDKFIDSIINRKLKVDYIVVCTPGDVLEKYLFGLFSTNKPLIILSTNYDETFVKSKIKRSSSSVVLSPNMALPILDFWHILDNTHNVEFGESIILDSAFESHPGFKKDISGTLIKTLEKFSSKKIKVDINIDSIKEVYKPYEDVKLSRVSWYRNHLTQTSKFKFLEKEFIDAHAYHGYVLMGDGSTDDKNYLEYLYFNLKRLNNYSNDNIIFDVKYHLDHGVLEIKHYINGRSIYGDGVAEAIKLLQKKDGFFTGIDLISDSFINKGGWNVLLIR